MELSLNRQTIEVETLIGENRRQIQVTADTATPGAGREIIEVLMEEAEVSIDSAEAQTDRVVVEGTVTCQAVYRQGEGAARAVAAQTKFSEAMELEGVTARSIVNVQGVVEDVAADYDNGRMGFHVVVGLRVQARELEPIELISQVTGVDSLEVQFVDVCSSKLAAESSAHAPVREEVALPGQLDAWVALMDWAQARLTHVERDLGGVRAQGEVQAEALIGTGVASRPVALVKVVMPFEQLIELPEWLPGNVTAEVSVKRLLTEVLPGDEEGEAVLRLEAEAYVHVRADAEDCATALGDVYATGDTGVACVQAPLTVVSGSEQINGMESFRGTLLLPDGVPAVGTVLATRVRPVISQWMASGSATVVEGALDVKALYMPSGSEQVTSVRGELPFSIQLKGTWPEDAWVNIVATGADATALMSDRLEVRCTLLLSGFYRNTQSHVVAREAAVVESPERKSGMVIYWPTEDDTCWSVGKRYVLPQRKVVAMNGGAETLVSGQPIVMRMS